MWGRVEYCRRLAITTADPHTANALIQMAAQGEADIPRLMSEQDAPTTPRAHPPGAMTPITSSAPGLTRA